VSGATAALSGFATPALSGDACAIATRGTVTAAATSIQNVYPRTRATTPAFIASPPFLVLSRARGGGPPPRINN
jgi:hypothetical protein